MSEKISIVVTSYNHVDFLRQRMESLLSQTYPNLEIIVVDDGSTDGSRELLQQFATNDKIRLFFLEKNRGFVHASNFGVAQAKGNFVIFAECDDFSEPEQIDTLYQVFTKYQNIGVVYSRSYVVDQNNQRIGLDYHHSNRKFRNFVKNNMEISGREMQKFFLYSCVIPNMSAAMFRKALFEQLNGLSDKYKLAADLDFWLRMTEICNFFYLTNPLNNFRDHAATLRNHVGVAGQLVESIRIISPVSRRISLTWKEKVDLKIQLGAHWLYYANDNFSAFCRSFFKVWAGCLKEQPLLLFFLLLNIPLLLVKKVVKQFYNKKI